GVADGPLEPRVREPREAIADLLARPGELLGGEAARGVATRPVQRLAQPALLVARRTRRQHRHRPVGALLDGGAQVVAEPEPLADLLEEARVGVCAHDLDRHRQREHAARVARRGHQTDEVGLRELSPAQAEEPGPAGARTSRPDARRVAVAGKRPPQRAADPAAPHAAPQPADHVGGDEVTADEGSDGVAGDLLDAGDRAAYRMAERLAEEARPRALVDVVARVFLPSADLVDHDTLLLGEAIGRDGRVEAL